MLSDTDLRTLARQALDAGIIPDRPPDRSWGVPGIGAPCIVCQDRVPAAGMAYELQFGRDGAAEPDRFHAHLRCAAILSFVRNRRHLSTNERRGRGGRSGLRERGEIVSAVTGPTAGYRRPFTLSGTITRWSATTRALSILDRDLQLTPHVPLAGLGVGLRIVVAGYDDPATGQMVVTRFASLP